MLEEGDAAGSAAVEVAAARASFVDDAAASGSAGVTHTVSDAGAGAPLKGRLWIYDALSGEGRTVKVGADPHYAFAWMYAVAAAARVGSGLIPHGLSLAPARDLTQPGFEARASRGLSPRAAGGRTGSATSDTDEVDALIRQRWSVDDQDF